MNKYLFFRTDRIGDFLVSAILLKAIKRNDKKAYISVVASSKNYFFIKTLDFIDEVFLYPNNFFKKILFFFNLRKSKYELICALDGKKRSIYFSLFLKSKVKILMTTKKIFKKLLNYFFSKVYLFEESKDKLEEIKDVLNLSKMSLDKSDVSYLKENKINLKKINLLKDFIIFHFDEKWIYEQYIKKYKSIEPSLDDLEEFICNLIKKSEKNLIITTGLMNNDLIKKLLLSFNKENENLYTKNFDDKLIQIYINIDFFELEYLIKNSSFLISCHGASTHLASAHGIKIYDIFDLSQKNFYLKWINHIENYSYFYRENFSDLNRKILKRI